MTEDDRYWSVTTLIGEGVPKWGLIEWAARVVAEYAVDEREAWAPLADSDRDGAVDLLRGVKRRVVEKAAARGTEVHRIAHGIMLDEPVAGEREDVEAYVGQYSAFLEEWEPEFLMAEAPVYSPKWRYAGTLDAIVKVGELTYVMDMKTTAKPPSHPGSRPPYPEIALQLVAYARAELVGLNARSIGEESAKRYYSYDEAAAYEPMPEVDGALALVVSPFDYVLCEVRIDDAIWKAWLHTREVARYQLETSRAVIGSPLSVNEEGA